MRTFKDILTSFEKNDFSAFEHMMKGAERDYLTAKRLSVSNRKYQNGYQTPPKNYGYGGKDIPYYDPRAANGAPLSQDAAMQNVMI
jgi:hypothetical protein